MSTYNLGLPFSASQGLIEMNQGPGDENPSHKDELWFSYDFDVNGDYTDNIEVLSVSPGTVIWISDGIEEGDNISYGGLGNAAIVRLDSGLYVLYAHLRSGTLPEKDSRVEEGDIIGYLGNTGATTGPHIHLSELLPIPWTVSGVI